MADCMHDNLHLGMYGGFLLAVERCPESVCPARDFVMQSSLAICHFIRTCNYGVDKILSLKTTSMVVKRMCRPLRDCSLMMPYFLYHLSSHLTWHPPAQREDLNYAMRLHHMLTIQAHNARLWRWQIELGPQCVMVRCGGRLSGLCQM